MKLLRFTKLVTDASVAGSVGRVVLPTMSSLEDFPWFAEPRDMGLVPVGKSGAMVRAFAVLSVAFLIAGYGCGSGNDGGQVGTASKRASKDTLKEEELYRYEGEGKAKRKVALSTREINQLLYEKKAGKPAE